MEIRTWRSAGAAIAVAFWSLIASPGAAAATVNLWHPYDPDATSFTVDMGTLWGVCFDCAFAIRDADAANPEHLDLFSNSSSVDEVSFAFTGSNWVLSARESGDTLMLRDGRRFVFMSSADGGHTWSDALDQLYESLANQWTLTFADGTTLAAGNVVPVPSPASALLFLAGSAALPVLAWRRRRAAHPGGLRGRAPALRAGA